MEQQKKPILYLLSSLEVLWGRTSQGTDQQLEKRGTSNDHWGKLAKCSAAHRDFCVCSNTKLDYKNPAREHPGYNPLKHSWVQRACVPYIEQQLLSPPHVLEMCVNNMHTNCTALQLHRIYDVCTNHHNSFPKGMLVCKSSGMPSELRKSQKKHFQYMKHWVGDIPCICKCDLSLYSS